ncbi:MAG: alpha-hydroxy-acid oxidizing protein, partial [Proteobacteria bacterium]|nr:alpha-hydroxy-acid oxidizing protein [Pseudomonadota bacterium]
IFKALALGARGVLIGRAWAWAMAGAGSAGLRTLLATLQRELELTMTFAGVTRIADIKATHLDRD